MSKKAADKDFDVIVYADGACSGNPGPGGWGAILKHPSTGKAKRISGGQKDTTNNRMELMACIVGLQSLKVPSSVIVHSDSKYVVDGISKGWARNWQANNWMRPNKQRAENADLWKQLLALCEKHKVLFTPYIMHPLLLNLSLLSKVSIVKSI